MPSEENNYGTSIVTMHNFLEFLKITCQVNESIDGRNNNNNTNSLPIDYNQLAKNELVNSLIGNNNNTNIKSDGVISDYEKDTDSRKSTPQYEQKSKEKIITKKKSITNSSKSQKSKNDGNNNDYKSQLDPALSDKLNEVINEGILDSVLPYVCPINSSAILNVTPKPIKSITNIRIQPQQVYDFKPPQNDLNSDIGLKKSPRPNETISVTNNLVPPPSRDRSSRRKSITSMVVSENRNESEVVIHVCDEVKGVSRDFMCPQKLLVCKMGYFADVTSGSSE